MHYRHRYTHSTLFILIFCLLAVSLLPVVAAAKPYLEVTPVWRPGVTLDSDGTDTRYVDVEIFVQGNVQFWAADFACTVPDAVITQYAQNTGDADPGNDEPMVRWGPDWSTDGSYVSMPAAANYLSTTDNGYTLGAISFSATRLGTAAPLGQNGLDYTLLVATLRFEVLQLPAAASAVFSCKVVQFLDRNGMAVAKAKLNKMSPLTVLDNYTIRGSVYYQGVKSSAGIGVQCDDAGAPPPISTVTDTKGVFTITTRVLDDYTCTFYGNALNPLDTARQDDVFLGGETYLTLNSHSHQLLPVLLRGGNTDPDAGGPGDEVVDVDDVTQVTFHWDHPVASPPFTNGDANGDGFANEADLAIVGGSYDLDEATLDYSHVIFGLARDYDDKLFPTPNSRIWFGDPQAGAVSELISSKSSPDFWPALSPNGTTVALSRWNSKTGNYELHKADLSKIPGSKTTLLTPKKGYTRDAFAPSWSPDGQRVAFICSDKDLGNGWEYNEGDVCVVDADGKNLHQIGSAAKLFPPAWYNDTVLLYAGLASNADCPKDLCFYDFLTGVTGAVDTSLATGNEVADMPSIQDGTLFFRYDDTSSIKLRYAPITSYTSGVFALGADLDIPQDTTDVDYYDVSPTLDIIFYEFGDDLFQNLNYQGGVSWSVGGDHYVDGFVGNVSWNGSLNTPTDLHALRATMDWVP